MTGASLENPRAQGVCAVEPRAVCTVWWRSDADERVEAFLRMGGNLGAMLSGARLLGAWTPVCESRP